MNIDDFEDLVLRYLDGMAADPEIDQLNALLKTRPDLADFFVQVTRNESLIRGAHEPQSLGLDENLTEEAALAAAKTRRAVRGPSGVERAVPLAFRPGRARAPGRPAWLPLAAAAAVLVALGTIVYNALTPDDVTPPRPRAARPKAVAPAPDAEAARRTEETAARAREESRRREDLARIEEEKKRLVEAQAKAPADQQEDLKRQADEELARVEARRRAAEAELAKVREEQRRAAEEAKKPVEAPRTVAADFTVERVEGEAWVVKGQDRAAAAPALAILADQAIETSQGRLVGVYADGTRLSLEPNTSVRGLEEGARGKRVFVDRGTVAAKVARQPAGRPMAFTTPHGEATVLGTALTVSVEGQTRLEVTEGRVKLTRAKDGKSIEVKAGHAAVAAAGVELVARPLGRWSEEFDAVPAWGSTWSAAWGTAAAWSVGPGQAGNGLHVERTGPGSSVVTLVYTVPPQSTVDVSAFLKCAGAQTNYWVEFGYRLGSHKASDFDLAPAAWTIIQKFEQNGGQNGNGSTWTRYGRQVRTGLDRQITIAFKIGARDGSGPALDVDSLRIAP